MWHKLNWMAVALVVLALGAAAQADTLQYGPTLYNNGGSDYESNASGAFYVPQFNPALGTLTSVELIVEGDSYGGTNGFQNTTAFSGTASVNIGSLIHVTGPSSLVVLTDPTQTNEGPVTANVNTPPNYTGSDAIFIAGTNSTDTESDTLYGGFAPYEGLGNVTYNFTSSVDGGYQANVTGVSGDTSTQFTFTPTVIYNYNAVPEPSTLALLGVGAIGLAGCVWRRRKPAE